MAGQQFFNFFELFILCSFSFHFLIFFVEQLQFQIFFQNYLVLQLQFFFPELILHKFSVEGYCIDSKKSLLSIRTIQGHAGGNLIAPEFMGHVAIPYKWKEFLFHPGCSFDVTSILKSGVITEGREKSREGRQTVFFTPLNLFGDNPDEEHPTNDLSSQRKVHLSQFLGLQALSGLESEKLETVVICCNRG